MKIIFNDLNNIVIIKIIKIVSFIIAERNVLEDRDSLFEPFVSSFLKKKGNFKKSFYNNFISNN